MKRLHYLQHINFENLGLIKNWAETENFIITKTALYNNNPLPEHNMYDWLVVLGGPMNIYEYGKYPWLKTKKIFIEKAIKNNKIVIGIGICLGAQLIADVLEAKIYKNKFKEIGWFPVTKTDKSRNSKIFASLPCSFHAFHWHADTFDIPEGSIHTISNAVCANQAFEYQGRVIGLQFHLESTHESVNSLITHCADEMTNEIFIQSKHEIISKNNNINESNNVIIQILNNLNKL